MASQGKKRAGKGPASTAGTLRADVDRLIEKERYKEAVKQAKLCYKQEATPEHRRLLERAYYLRANQLRQNGMPTAAQEVAQHLLAFGITDADLIEPAAELTVAVGLAGESLALQGRLDTPEARDRLLRQAADQAVRQPDRLAASQPELAAGGRQVRQALAALEAGDEAAALAALQGVARGSPFADWKLFVRGLAAFYRDAHDEVRANWDRLAPGRAPARIARALLATGSEKVPADGTTAAPRLEALERRVFGEPVLGPLRAIGEMAAQDRWHELVRDLAPLRFRLRKIDPALAERLTSLLVDPLVNAATSLDYDEGIGLLHRFTRVAEPLALDPGWNRFWATIWESMGGGNVEAERYWMSYVVDLQTIPALTPEERKVAEALVWERLGTLLVDPEGMAEEPDPDESSPSRGRGPGATAKRGIEYLEKCLRLLPNHRGPYRLLRDAYNYAEKPDQAADVARRQVAIFPDDDDAVLALSAYHYVRDEPVEALEFARRARALRPLDATFVVAEWGALAMLARHHAVGGRYDESRAALDAAEQLPTPLVRGCHFLARRAVLELKAGQPDRARSWIDRALESLTEPAPLWLAIVIEGRRYHLPRPELEPYEAQWSQALTKKARGETAGELAEVLAPFLGEEVDYPGRDEHVRQVVLYLEHTTRIKYRREDLEQVVAFLSLLPDDRPLFEKLAKRGLKLFPEAPDFVCAMGTIELAGNPSLVGLNRARAQFEKALALAQAEAATRPRSAHMVEKIKAHLAALDRMRVREDDSPFDAFPPDLSEGDLPEELREIMEKMARRMGVGLDELLEHMAEAGLYGVDLPQPPPGRGKKPPEPKKKKR